MSLFNLFRTSESKPIATGSRQKVEKAKRNIIKRSNNNKWFEPEKPKDFKIVKKD